MRFLAGSSEGKWDPFRDVQEFEWKCPQRLKERKEEPPCWDFNCASQKTEQLVLRSCEIQHIELTFCTLYFTHCYLIVMLFPLTFLFPPIAPVTPLPLNIGAESLSVKKPVKPASVPNGHEI